TAATGEELCASGGSASILERSCLHCRRMRQEACLRVSKDSSGSSVSIREEEVRHKAFQSIIKCREPIINAHRMGFFSCGLEDISLLVGARYCIEKISIVKIENRIYRWILTISFKIKIASERNKVMNK
ncbi:hypothetical protein ig2599ANME_0452, partial [groundwater metagenome]